MLTPQHGSRYCSQHQLRACDFNTCETTDETIESGMKTYDKYVYLVINILCLVEKDRLHAKAVAVEPVVEMLLQKKELCNKTMYKVYTCVYFFYH